MVSSTDEAVDWKGRGATEAVSVLDGKGVSNRSFEVPLAELEKFSEGSVSLYGGGGAGSAFSCVSTVGATERDGDIGKNYAFGLGIGIGRDCDLQLVETRRQEYCDDGHL